MTESMTPADIAAVTNGCNDGFGGNGAWWIIILFLFAFTGNWGGMQGGGAANNYVLASDFATIQRQIDSGIASLERKGDSINNGLCDGFYAMNTTLLNGFNGVNSNITQSQINAMQNANAIQSQLASCCCDNREAIAGVNYNLATQSCATNTAIATSARDIVDSQNANTQSILAAIAKMESDAKDNKIADQQAQINALQLAASQQAQNNYLVSRLQPTPVPSFPASNLYGFYGCGCNGGNI